MKKIIHFFDHLEDVVRSYLSHRPILYTLIGGVAIVLFWRGVWMVADMFNWLTGPVSVILSVLILLVTGLFVSFFIGDKIIISGLKREKKLSEKTESEIESVTDDIKELKEELKEVKEIVEDTRDAVEKDSQR